MGRKIFISFLGTGPEGDGYSELDYTMKGKSGTISTEFVQRAEIEFLGKESFDKIFILCTEESYKDPFPYLPIELERDLNVNTDIIHPVLVDKIRAVEHAWRLFDIISGLVNEGDCLTFDFTHGFRSLPIILSTALNFILKSKENIRLEHVFYGERSDDQSKGQIIDIKDFYIINEWADGVNRLVEIADTSKLALLVNSDANTHFHQLNDGKLISGLQLLTDTLKNIDINRITRRTETAIEIIDNFLKKSSGAEKVLLELVKKKFQPLLRKSTGRYDKDYFLLQIKIMQMLIQHNLYMQFFTVAREFIGSVGMIGAPKGYTENIHDNGTADNRTHYADLFVRMMTYNQFQTKPGNDKEQKRFDELNMSIYSQLEKIGQLEKFKSIARKVKKVRDGFDHAWTGKGDKSIQKIKNFEDTAVETVEFLDKFVNLLIKDRIIQ